jgi:SseB protein C-terminal domain
LFLGEQRGDVERELKKRLSEYFSRSTSVSCAYLVRASYKETPGINIALCILAKLQSRNELLPAIEQVFGGLFHATQHMDILFLSKVQLQEINKVAKPFYTASAP